MKEFKIHYSYLIVNKQLEYVDSAKESFTMEVSSRGQVDTKELILRVQRIAQQKCKKGEFVRDANYYMIEELA